MNASAPAATRVRTLHAAITATAAERPDHPAIEFEGTVLTYAQLDRWSNRTARALGLLGLGPGDRLAYVGRESDRYYALAVACAKAGVVLVPVNWRLTPGEVEHIVVDSDSRVLVHQEQFADGAQSLGPVRSGAVRTLPLGPGEREDATSLDELAAVCDDDPLPASAEPGHAFTQIYTSGTTGAPKGVVVSQQSFFVMLDAQRSNGLDWVDLGPDDRSLVAMPGFHLSGLSWFMQGLIVGATNIVVRMFVGHDALRLIRDDQVTITFIAPAMLRMLLDEARGDSAAFTTLRKVVYGGAPMSEDLLVAGLDVLRCDFVQLYASTESGNGSLCLPPVEHCAGNPRMRSVGRAFPGVEVLVTDTDGAALPAGETGEIRIRSDASMLEYWANPTATRETLSDGWVRMGDAGYMDEDGFLFLRDRVKDMIIVAGENIYPTEIENVLRRHPAVADAAVIGVPDPRWGEAVMACIQLEQGETARARQFLLHLRGQVADYKLPTKFEFVDTLPRNTNGKVLRRELRETYWSHLTERIN